MFYAYLTSVGMKIWHFLVGPVRTFVIWLLIDYAIRVLYDKSNFIERFFASYSPNVKRRAIIQQRIKTLRGLLLQCMRGVVGIFFVFIMLGHFNIDPKPLLAGIGVVGLGLSLAAQNILRDFLNGVFIIIEDQFNVGDWVTIGSFSGTVESFTMRLTRLRTTEGKLITIPNNTISEVVNSTKDFAVAYIEVGVSYSSDIKKVVSVLKEAADEAAKNFQGSVLGEPVVHGILAFRDSDISFRVMIKTHPGEQWAVERAVRVAIKERFDAEGIEIPFPQVVVNKAAE
jgi:small conductance mechanosensitive channel